MHVHSHKAHNVFSELVGSSCRGDLKQNVKKVVKYYQNDNCGTKIGENAKLPVPTNIHPLQATICPGHFSVNSSSWFSFTVQRMYARFQLPSAAYLLISRSWLKSMKLYVVDSKLTRELGPKMRVVTQISSTCLFHYNTSLEVCGTARFSVSLAPTLHPYCKQ